MQQNIDFYKNRVDALLLDHSQSRLKDVNSVWLNQLLYPLKSPAKRLRPLIVYASVLGFGGKIDHADSIALAIEYLHTYSLIHDDLPAMDDDVFRRGWPCLHRRAPEAVAILAGDALLTEAFVILSQSTISPTQQIQLIQHLAQAASARELIYGQWLDLYGNIQTLDDLIHLHKKKTGALFRYCFSSGALLSSQRQEIIDACLKMGDIFGVAFQLQDDCMDYLSDKKAARYSKISDLIEKNAQKIQSVIKSDYDYLIEKSRQIFGSDSLIYEIIASISQRHL